MLPPEKATAPSLRGSGSLGPSVHWAKLPGPETVERKVVSVGFVPSLPPMNSSVDPDCDSEPSVRGAGSEISCGATSHAIVAPTGGGHGSDSFEGGQKLMGLQARI